MLKPLVSLYREAGFFARACPLLFLVPVAAEITQHVIEYAQGFYDGIAGARAAQASGLRLGFGIVKILTVLLIGYWMIRWLEWKQPRRVGERDLGAYRRFAPLLALEIVLELTALWALQSVRPAPGVVLAAILLPLLIMSALSDWRRTAPLGAVGGPLISIWLVTPILRWAFAFALIAELPVMIVHYALGFAAIKGPAMLKPVLLAGDSLLVGYLSAVVTGVPWFVSERARLRRTALILADRGPSS